jgi:hypothetical protein
VTTGDWQRADTTNLQIEGTPKGLQVYNGDHRNHQAGRCLVRECTVGLGRILVASFTLF